MLKKKQEAKNPKASASSRRAFFSNLFMGTGLLTSHLFAAGLAVRYLYPTKNVTRQRLFVGIRSEIPPGSAFVYEAPGGETINIVRGIEGFIALSDVCPHLGCRVHWEAQKEEFICPCHDGHFHADGTPKSGPPAEMGAALPSYKLVEDGDVLFIEMERKGKRA